MGCKVQLWGKPPKVEEGRTYLVALPGELLVPS